MDRAAVRGHTWEGGERKLDMAPSTPGLGIEFLPVGNIGVALPRWRIHIIPVE